MLIHGLAHGLSKSILKTPHRQINNVKHLIFTTGGVKVERFSDQVEARTNMHIHGSVYMK